MEKLEAVGYVFVMLCFVGGVYFCLNIISAANKSHHNSQIESIKIKLEMYKTCVDSSEEERKSLWFCR